MVADTRGIAGMQRLGRAWWIMAPLALAGAAAFWLAQHERSDTQRYITLPVTRGALEQTVSAVGVLQPSQYVDVGTQVSGQLRQLHVEIGREVRKNDLVAEIDPTLFNAKVEETRATLHTFEAQLADRRAQLHLARQTSSRRRQLYANKAISEEALDQGATAEAQAQAQVGVLQAQIEQARSQLKADEANLRFTKIYAPMAGTVVSLPARQGQTLVASQAAPTIMRIADLNTMTVWAQTSEVDVPKIKVGMPVYFNTLGQAQRRWAGAVRQIYPTPETLNNVVLYDVLFDVANPDQQLKPQMSAQVYFVLGRADHALLVPLAALQAPRAGSEKGAGPAADPRSMNQLASPGYTVRVLRNNKVEQRPVTIGLVNRVSAQVLSGLAEGERVVVGVVENARDPAATRPGALQAGGRGTGRP